MCQYQKIDVSNLELIEAKGRFDRYQIEEEESIWVCSVCGCEGDPWEEGTCECADDDRS